MVRRSEKPYVVVNFFTSYCKPCIREIPDLVAMDQDEDGLSGVVFVSIDDPDPEGKVNLAGFLGRVGVAFEPYHFNPDSVVDFIRTHDPSWNRQIPYNMIFARDGRLVATTGMTDQTEVEMIVHKDQHFHPANQQSSQDGR